MLVFCCASLIFEVYTFWGAVDWELNVGELAGSLMYGVDTPTGVVGGETNVAIFCGSSLIFMLDVFMGVVDWEIT